MIEELSKFAPRLVKFSIFYILVVFVALFLQFGSGGKNLLFGLSAIVLIAAIYGGCYFYIRNMKSIYQVIKHHKDLDDFHIGSIFWFVVAIILCIIMAIGFGSFAYWRIANDM